jgi:hypothetical protein
VAADFKQVAGPQFKLPVTTTTTSSNAPIVTLGHAASRSRRVSGDSQSHQSISSGSYSSGTSSSHANVSISQHSAVTVPQRNNNQSKSRKSSTSTSSKTGDSNIDVDNAYASGKPPQSPRGQYDDHDNDAAVNDDDTEVCTCV